jgi:hypothetical protein
MSKSRRVRSLVMAILVVAAALLPASAAFAEKEDYPATYSITLENLTHTQPFSPPIFVTHTPAYSLFSVGALASDGIRFIAETGNNGPATAEATASHLTFNVVAQSALIFPGGSATAEISAPPGARFSFAAMLGITNDGFTGLDTVRLPKSGSVSYDLVGYDAGTETNNELIGYVGALGGGNMRAPTHDPIALHPGILGVGDMDPAQYGWQDPVGRLTITRID